MIFQKLNEWSGTLIVVGIIATITLFGNLSRDVAVIKAQMVIMLANNESSVTQEQLNAAHNRITELQEAQGSIFRTLGTVREDIARLQGDAP